MKVILIISVICNIILFVLHQGEIAEKDIWVKEWKKLNKKYWNLKYNGKEV